MEISSKSKEMFKTWFTIIFGIRSLVPYFFLWNLACRIIQSTFMSKIFWSWYSILFWSWAKMWLVSDFEGMYRWIPVCHWLTCWGLENFCWSSNFLLILRCNFSLVSGFLREPVRGRASKRELCCLFESLDGLELPDHFVDWCYSIARA